MTTREEVIQKWTGPKSLNLLYPGKCVWPDSDCEDMILDLCTPGFVAEIGCGNGRVANVLNPKMYIGVDINERAIEQARKNCPEHNFRCIGYDDDYPIADMYLFYTVLLHVRDEDLPSVIERCHEANKVIVFESMCPRLRNHGDDFQRGMDDYDQVFKQYGWELDFYVRKLSDSWPHFRDYAVWRNLTKGEEG